MLDSDIRKGEVQFSFYKKTSCVTEGQNVHRKNVPARANVSDVCKTVVSKFVGFPYTALKAKAK